MAKMSFTKFEDILIPFVDNLKVYSTFYTPILKFLEPKITAESNKLSGRKFIKTKNQWAVFRIHARTENDEVFVVSTPDKKNTFQIRRFKGKTEVAIINFDDSAVTFKGELISISKPDQAKLLFNLLQELETL